MGPMVGLHVLLAGEDSITCVMAAFDRLETVNIGSMFQELFSLRALKQAAIHEASQWFAIPQCAMRLHMGLESSTLTKSLATSGARIFICLTVQPCLICMYADQVAAQRVALHRSVPA